MRYNAALVCAERSEDAWRYNLRQFRGDSRKNGEKMTMY